MKMARYQPKSFLRELKLGAGAGDGAHLSVFANANPDERQERKKRGPNRFKPKRKKKGK